MLFKGMMRFLLSQRKYLITVVCGFSVLYSVLLCLDVPNLFNPVNILFIQGVKSWLKPIFMLQAKDIIQNTVLFGDDRVIVTSTEDELQSAD
jgi:hypothetical protein